jgi:predicted peptidase
MKRIFTLSLAIALLSGPTLKGEKPAPGVQVELTHKISDQQTIPYLFYLPKGFDGEADKKWPLILFLHGRGESRGPLSIVAKWGPPRMAKRGDDPPYLVISPQCPASTRWTADDQQAGVLNLLDHIIEKYPVDPSRIYLTGLSMGGYGSWKLAADHPQRFAAVAPVCGKGNPADGEKLKDLPIWVFHGTQDDAVPYQHSVDMVEAIKMAGGKRVRFTSMKHVGHNCWSAAYATPELYQWFNKHRRRD